jgi:Ca2+-binding RTX toxin-like protein
MSNSNEAIRGTEKADLINAVEPSKSFFIDGLAGNDLISVVGGGHARVGSNAGDDNVVIVPSDSNRVFGGAGKDPIAIFGGNNNQIFGGSDLDRIVIGAGNNNQIFGQDGKDRLTLGNGNNNQAFGGSEEDIIIGGDGNNTELFGGLGNDIIVGRAGNDKIVGGSGNDILFGAAGNDTLRGGGGQDRFTYQGGIPFDTSRIGIDNIADLRTNRDKIVLERGTFTALQSSAGQGFDVTIEFAVVNSDAEAETSAAFIAYNAQNGKLFYNQNGSEAGLGEGAQFAILQGNPQLNASDFLLEEIGSSTAEDDSIVLETSSQRTIDGQTGDDNIIIRGVGVDPNNFAAGNFQNQILGDVGDDFITVEDGSMNTISSGDGDDDVTIGNGIGNVVLGDRDDDAVAVINGSDNRIEGGTGNDVVAIGGTASVASGDEGEDLLYAFGGGNQLLGGDGNDILIGTSANGDRLDGESGEDLMTGGSGNDTLTGSAGSDRFIFDVKSEFAAAKFGIDAIADFEPNADKIVLSKSTFTAIASNVGDGFSAAGDFAIVTNDADAATNSAFVVYNSTTGSLFYNQNSDASGLDTGAQFATIENAPMLATSDFVITA